MSKDVAAADCPPEQASNGGQGKIVIIQGIDKLQEEIGVKPDGQFGPKSSAALDAYLKQNKLSEEGQKIVDEIREKIGNGMFKQHIKDVEDCKVDGTSGQNLGAPPVSEEKGPMARPKEESSLNVVQNDKELLHSGPPEKAPDPKAGFIAPEPAQMPPVDPMGNYTGGPEPTLSVVQKELPANISGLPEVSTKAELNMSAFAGTNEATSPWSGADGANPAFSGNTWSISEMFGKVANVFSGAVAPAAAAPQPNTYVPQTGTNGPSM